MLFALICTDRAGHLDTRLATRDTHLAFLDSQIGRLAHAGALLDGDGKPCGSLLIIEAKDQADAEAFAASDPYAQAGLFASTVIRPYRAVFKDGARL